MVDHVADPRTHEGCRTLELELHGEAGDTCGSPRTERFAVASCVGGFPEVTTTVIRRGEGGSLTGFLYSAATAICSCGLESVRSGPSLGTPTVLTYQSGDEADGVVQFALSGQDMTVLIEACAW